MTERSMFWADGVGDGGPYTHDQLRLLYDALAGSEDADRGVLETQGTELIPSSTGANNIRMGTGRAVVDGTQYENDAVLDIATASPAIGTTGRRCVLQKDWTARTVRAVIITSADGNAAIPALTQNDGTIWEIPICSFTITTGGAIGALTDQRVFAEGTDSRAITIMDRDLSQSDAAGGTAEISMFSHSIPAYAMGTTGGVRLTLGGDALVNAAGTLIIRVKLGATTVLTSAALDFPNSASRYKWFLEILCMNSAADAQKWIAHLEAVVGSDDFAWQNPSNDLSVEGAAYGTSTEDTTGALTLNVTVQWSAASANLSWRKEIALLERIPPA